MPAHEEVIPERTYTNPAHWETIPGYYRPGNWILFVELSDWVATDDWSPVTSTIPAGQSFPRSRPIAKISRTGERSECGEERNVTTTTVETSTENGTGIGTLLAVWVDFTEVISSVPTTDWTPTLESKPAGLIFTQERIVDVTRRTGGAMASIRTRMWSSR